MYMYSTMLPTCIHVLCTMYIAYHKRLYLSEIKWNIAHTGMYLFLQVGVVVNEAAHHVDVTVLAGGLQSSAAMEQLIHGGGGSREDLLYLPQVTNGGAVH